VVGGGASPFSGDACAGRAGLGAGQVEADAPPFPRRRGTRARWSRSATCVPGSGPRPGGSRRGRACARISDRSRNPSGTAVTRQSMASVSVRVPPGSRSVPRTAMSLIPERRVSPGTESLPSSSVTRPDMVTRSRVSPGGRKRAQIVSSPTRVGGCQRLHGTCESRRWCMAPA
jgi:hypothetical protein